MELRSAHKKAIVFGGSGLVGGHLLYQLLESPAYSQVAVFGRRELDLDHPRLEQHIIDFDDPASWEAGVKGDDLFICLGTTMKMAGSRDAFYRVDFTYASTAARIASRRQVGQVLVVSSAGADAGSVFYYSRVKGELEDAVKKLPFWSIHILRPSLLLGDRREQRPAEQAVGWLGRALARVTGGSSLFGMAPIEAATVARAMVRLAGKIESGIFVHTSADIQRLGAPGGTQIEKTT